MSKKMKFDESIEEINNIISQLESREVSLEDSIDKYQKAMKLIANCYEILNSVEGKVEKILNK